jgi:nicotinamidase/pyrazinamidase
MTFPHFYKAEHVGDLYPPNTAAAIDAGSAAGLPPAADDKRRVILVLVDMQVDFIHPQGALTVPGAVADLRHTIEWLLRNAGHVTTIAASLDSHVPVQIFAPAWWVDNAGKHPAPFTVITSDEVQMGHWHPLYETGWSLQYVKKLEAQSRKQLMIWPYHTLIGTPGHNLMPALYEAIAYHSAARRTQPVFLTKGTIPKTEYYSMLEPEVKVPEIPQGSLNISFLEMLRDYQLVYIAGEAKSHCVLETVNSVMRYFQKAPDVISKLRIISDGMSSIAHPEIDFEGIANETFARYEQQGLRLVKSADDLA